MKKFALVALAATLSFPALAVSEVDWSFDKGDGSGAKLYGQPADEESDQVFWARCRKDGRIDIGVGAHDGVGEGKGETVSATLASGGKTKVLKGTSRESGNFQMTGGTELTATVSRDDPVFAVLATGKPINAAGAGDKPPKTDMWGVTGLQQSLNAFLAACPAQH